MTQLFNVVPSTHCSYRLQSHRLLFRLSDFTSFTIAHKALVGHSEGFFFFLVLFFGILYLCRNGTGPFADVPPSTSEGEPSEGGPPESGLRPNCLAGQKKKQKQSTSTIGPTAGGSPASLGRSGPEELETHPVVPSPLLAARVGHLPLLDGLLAEDLGAGVELLQLGRGAGTAAVSAHLVGAGLLHQVEELGAGPGVVGGAGDQDRVLEVRGDGLGVVVLGGLGQAHGGLEGLPVAELRGGGGRSTGLDGLGGSGGGERVLVGLGRKGGAGRGLDGTSVDDGDLGALAAGLAINGLGLDGLGLNGSGLGLWLLGTGGRGVVEPVVVSRLVLDVADGVLVGPRVALELELVEKRSGGVEFGAKALQVVLVESVRVVGVRGGAERVLVGCVSRGVGGAGVGVQVGLAGSSRIGVEEGSGTAVSGLLVHLESARVVEELETGVALGRGGRGGRSGRGRGRGGGLIGHDDVGGALVSDGVGGGGGVRLIGVVSHVVLSLTHLRVCLGNLGGFGDLGRVLGAVGRGGVVGRGSLRGSRSARIVFTRGQSIELRGSGLVDAGLVRLLAGVASILVLDFDTLDLASSAVCFEGSARVDWWEGQVFMCVEVRIYVRGGAGRRGGGLDSGGEVHLQQASEIRTGSLKLVDSVAADAVPDGLVVPEDLVAADFLRVGGPITLVAPLAGEALMELPN